MSQRPIARTAGRTARARVGGPAGTSRLDLETPNNRAEHAERAARAHPSVAVALSGLWPGLGQLYLGQWRRAALYAIPWILVVAAAASAFVVGGPTTIVWILVPAVTIAAFILLALHGFAAVASVVDAWRRTRHAGSRSGAATGLTVVLVAALVGVHVFAGATLKSVADAGQQMLGVDVPSGDTGLDQALGGPSGGAGASGRGGTSTAPCPSADPGDAGHGDIPTLAPGATAEPAPDGDPADEPPGVDPSIRPPQLPCASTGPGTSTAAGGVIDDDIGSLPRDGPINVLFVGVDSGLGRTHALTDTVFLASYNRDTGAMTMISIPRDTGRVPLYIGGTFRPKFNEFLGYANAHPKLFPEGGINALMREVGYILGVDVHFYVATDLEGFPVLVDMVGGVTVDNQARLLLDSGEYLDPGPVHLDGTKALMYARARHGPGNNDWERARRQQQVVKALMQKMARPELIPRFPALIEQMATYARTNAEASQLPELLPIFMGAAQADTAHIVLQPNRYARRLPTSETGGLYMTQLRMSVVADLSVKLFGEHSRYAK